MGRFLYESLDRKISGVSILLRIFRTASINRAFAMGTGNEISQELEPLSAQFVNDIRGKVWRDQEELKHPAASHEVLCKKVR